MFTRRAVWRWPRTALWTGVSPSLARKSMWAPPSTRTRIASPPPGSHCTAKDRAVSGTHTHTHTDSNGVFNGQKDWFGGQTIRTTLARLFAPSRSLSGKTVSTIQVNYLHSNSLEVILLNTCSFVLTGSTKTHFIQPQSRHPGHSDGVWLIFSALWVSEQSVLRNSESAEKWNSCRKKSKYQMLWMTNHSMELDKYQPTKCCNNLGVPLLTESIKKTHSVENHQL